MRRSVVCLLLLLFATCAQGGEIRDRIRKRMAAIEAAARSKQGAPSPSGEFGVSEAQPVTVRPSALTVGTYHYTIHSAALYPGARGQELILDLTVKNRDRENRRIPPFKVLGKDKKAYKAKASAFWAEYGAMLPFLHRLRPGKSKRGKIAFDVARGKGRLRLRLTGGYWSRKVGWVTLQRTGK